MLTPCEKLKLCSMILEIGRHEKKIEAVRQLMCEHSDFAPFNVFRSLDVRQANRICASDIQQFLTINCAEPNTAPPTLVACELFIKLFDRNSDNLLSYDEFLSAILPQDNNQLRQTAISKESTPPALQSPQTSAMRSTSSAIDSSKEEIEYMLAKLIDWSIKGASDLESEKYAFLGQQQRGNIALFLEECFHAIDVNRSNQLTTKSVQAFFESNQQGAVDYSDEIRAFFRRASFSAIHHIDTISKSEFTAILDFAPYNNNSNISSKSRPNPPPCLLDNSYNNSFSSTPHNVTTNGGNIFDETDNQHNHHPNAALVLRNTSYIAANSNSEPGSNNTMKSLFKQTHPADSTTFAVPTSSNKNPKRKLSFHSSINEKGEKEHGTNENQSNAHNNNMYEHDPTRRRSSQYSVVTQKSKSRQPTDEHSIDSIHQQRVEEDNSRVGLIELLTNAKRSGAATMTSIASSSCRVSPANNRVSVPSSRKSNQSQQQHPFTFGGVGAAPISLLNASFQSRTSSRSRSSLRQQLIDFKQEIRGQLASSKAKMESLSPMKTSTPQHQQQPKFNTSTKVEKQKQQQPQSLNQSQVLRASIQSSKNNSQKSKENTQTQLQNSFYSTVKSQSIRRQSMSSSFSNNNSSSLNSSASQYSHQQNNNPGSISNLQQSFTSMQQDRRSANHSRISKQSQQQQQQQSSSGTSNKKKTTAVKQSNSGVKTLRQSMKTHVNNYLMNVLANAKRVESLKIELTARHDFNQFQLFELLDRQQRGSISSFDIHLFLASQSVSIPLPEIVILMKRLDRLRIGTVSFSSFSAVALTSEQQNRIGANRSGVSLLPEAALSRDTILVFTELLEALITAENKLELLRQTMSKDKHWDLIFLGALIVIISIRTYLNSSFEIHCADTSLNSEIIASCASIKKRRYFPTPYLPLGFLQATYGSQNINYDKDVRFRKTYIHFHRYGEFGIDWAYSEKPLPNRVEKPKKLVCIFPGLTSPISEANIMAACFKAGYEVCLLNDRWYTNRDSGRGVTLPEEGHFTFADDYKRVIEVIAKQHQGYTFYAIGHSFGANNLAMYLGKYAAENIFKAAVCVSNPWDFDLTIHFIPPSVNTFLMKSRMRVLRNNHHIFKDKKPDHIDYDYKKVIESKTCRELDNNFTSKCLGFASAREYYQAISSVNVISRIQIPLLAIQAKDDPILEECSIPKDEAKLNPNIILLITNTGGHVGWFEGFFKPRRWYINPALEFLKFFDD